MNYLNINLGAFGIIATILAIAATVVAFVMIVPERKREKLGRFGKFLHDAVNFKFLIVEKILQALYIFVTAYVILCGFFMLFMAPETWTGRHWLGGYGILLMVLGPIAVRLCYELLMMAVLLLKNVISINRKLKNQNERSADADLFAVPELHRTQPAKPAAPVTPVAPAAPAQRSTPFQPAEQAAPVAPSFCTRCGAHLDENEWPLPQLRSGVSFSWKAFFRTTVPPPYGGGTVACCGYGGVFYILSPVGSFLPIAAESLHRRVSRSPATLWHGNRDTSSKPPRCIRLWRIQRGGFQRTPAETHGFCPSFAACFARWRKTGYTFITLRSVFDGICIGNQKAYSSGVPDKTSKAVLLGRGDTAP